MRGKDFEQSEILMNIRITPAYAGKSLQDRTGTRKKRDHPRLCGEKVKRAASVRPEPGSPPPMRGKAGLE